MLKAVSEFPRSMQYDASIVSALTGHAKISSSDVDSAIGTLNQLPQRLQERFPEQYAFEILKRNMDGLPQSETLPPTLAAVVNGVSNLVTEVKMYFSQGGTDFSAAF